MNDEEIDKKMLEAEVGSPVIQDNEKSPLDTELANEALAASEKAAAEEAPASESEQAAEGQAGTEAEGDDEQKEVQDPKISAAFGKQRREYEAQIADANRRLSETQQQLQGQQSAAAVVAPVKSPEEVWIEDHPELLDEPFPARVVIEQRKFDREQTAQTQQVQSNQTRAVAAVNSVKSGLVTITDETHGVGLQSLQSIGVHLLTDNDVVLVNQAGEEAGEMLHSILKRRIKAAGGVLAEVLNEKLKPSAKVPKTPKTPDGAKPDAKKPNEQVNQNLDEGPVPEAHVSQIMSDMYPGRT